MTEKKNVLLATEDYKDNIVKLASNLTNNLKKEVLDLKNDDEYYNMNLFYDSAYYFFMVLMSKVCEKTREEIHHLVDAYYDGNTPTSEDEEQPTTPAEES